MKPSSASRIPRVVALVKLSREWQYKVTRMMLKSPCRYEDG
jgi:hypothetical protein